MARKPLGQMAFSASPFHSVTEHHVYLSPDPADGEVYEYGSEKEGGKWVDTFAPTKQGLAKLMEAAGIVVITNHQVETDGDFIVSWHYGCERTRPDTTKARPEGDYTLDLRLENQVEGGGARYQEFVQGNLDRYAKGWAKKQNIRKQQWESPKDFALRLWVEHIPDDVRETMEARAREAARRAVIAMRPHIHSRAQTGALNRAIRQELGLNHTYTAKQLLEEPFVLQRAEFRFEEMIDRLTPAKREAALLSLLAQHTGLDPIQLAAVVQTIGEPEPDQAVEEDDDGLIDAEIIEPETAAAEEEGEIGQQMPLPLPGGQAISAQWPETWSPDPHAPPGRELSGKDRHNLQTALTDLGYHSKAIPRLLKACVGVNIAETCVVHAWNAIQYARQTFMIKQQFDRQPKLVKKAKDARKTECLAFTERQQFWVDVMPLDAESLEASDE